MWPALAPSTEKFSRVGNSPNSKKVELCDKFSTFHISKRGRDFFAKISGFVGNQNARVVFSSNGGRPPNFGVAGGPIFENFQTGSGAEPPRGETVQRGSEQFGAHDRG